MTARNDMAPLVPGTPGSSIPADPRGLDSIQPPGWLPDELAPLFELVMRELPAFPDRRTAAAVWTARVHPWDHRTLEGLPLTTRRLNGRACFCAREFVELGFRRLLESPPTRGGRRATQEQRTA
jgi:hypothetical protein